MKTMYKTNHNRPNKQHEPASINHHKSPISAEFKKRPNEQSIDPVLKALIEGTALSEKDKQRLLQHQSTELTQQLECLFKNARTARKLFANTRQLNYVLMKTIPDKQTSENLASSRIVIGWAQLASEMLETVDFFRKKNHLNPKEAPKLLCIVIGMAALTATTLGLGGGLLLNIATAFRGLTSGLKSLIRQIENERNLYQCTQKLILAKQELVQLSIMVGIDISVQQQLMANCVRMQEEHDALKKIVDSNAMNALERVTQLANLSIVIGAIMLCFPVTVPIGAWFILIGNAVRFALGAGSATENIPVLKKWFLSKVHDAPKAPEPNDDKLAIT